MSFTPPARPELLDPELQRPDWTKPGARDPRLLWLDKNENDDPALLAVTKQVLHEIDPRSVAVYPDCSKLYAALSKYLGVDARTLLLAPGSDGVIGATFRAFIGVGDPVVHTSPTYLMYAVYARMFGAKVTTVPYDQRDGVPFMDPNRLINAIRDARPKLVCLPNPDSPTGTVIEPDALRRVIAAAHDVGALIQVDEAYHPFYRESALPLIKDYPNLIVVRTFSKAWGMTGIRLGYGISSPQVTALMHKVRPSFEVNEVAVHMAVRMLTDFEEEMLASVRRIVAGRDAFRAAMESMRFRTLHTHANFTHVAFGAMADPIHAALADVALYRRDLVDAPLAGFSRFTATTVERFEPVIATIKRVHQEWSR